MKRARARSASCLHPGPCPPIAVETVAKTYQAFFDDVDNAEKIFGFGGYEKVSRTQQIKAAEMMTDHNQLLISRFGGLKTGLRFKPLVLQRGLMLALNSKRGKMIPMPKKHTPKQFAIAIVNVTQVLFCHARYLPGRRDVAANQLEEKDKKKIKIFAEKVANMLSIVIHKKRAGYDGT